MVTMKPPNPRFWQDEDGQWWCPTGAGNSNPPRPGRTRCKVKTCGHCGEEYLVSPFAASASKYCGKECFGLARRGNTDWQGEKSPHWKGGRVMRRGYVLIFAPDHHSIGPDTQRKYVLEHRLVMEEKLGRALLATEQVHHINGDRADNRPENLELWTTGHSTPGVRAADVKHCPTCTCAEHGE